MDDAFPSVDLLPLDRLDDVVDVYAEAFSGYPVMRVTVGDEGDIAARERRLIRLFVTRRTRRGGPMYGVSTSKTSKTSKESKLAGAVLLTLPVEAAPASRRGACSSELDRMVRFHMLNFDLTEEQRMLEQTVRDWGAREVQPHIRELDRAHKFDPKVFPQMAKLGLLGCSVPEEYGGAGMDYISLGIISEELEYVDTSLRVIMSVHAGLNCLTLLSWGTEEQKQRYLVPQARGEQIATYGLTEPAAGSDARGIQTVAIRKGDRYHLTGEKMWISLADVADNVIVFAWTDLEKKKKKDPSGLSAFIIERRFKGFSSGTLKEKWGILAGNTGFFKMEEMEVPAENLLGREGEGFKIAMFALDQGRYTVAAGATGLIRACRDASAKYAKDRRAFGVEIGQHQLVKQMIANMESDYQNSRLLWMRAGWMKNIGRRNTRETGLAKWFATVASERCAGDAVQVHGANGYSDEYPVGRFYRNCKGAVIYEGTREIHTLMQADYVLGYRQDKPTRCELPAYSAVSGAAPAAGKR